MKKTTLAMSALALSLGLALSPLSATAAETASSAATAQQMPSLAPMLEKVMPSVVSINVEGSTTVNTPRMPRNFQQFFGDNSPFCQDGSPFQSSPFCQGGGQVMTAEAATVAVNSRNSWLLALALSSMRRKAMS